MRIGDVAAELGIPASTIRFYERKGVIRRLPRVAGQREFGREAVEELAFVRLAQSAGFTMAEIRSIVAGYDRDRRPSAVWAELANDKREEIKQRVEQLQRMDALLGRLVACECASIGECVSRTQP